MALENIPTIGPGALNANLDKVVVYKNGGSEAAVSLLTLTNSALSLSGVYLDSVNRRVGINTDIPSADLHIDGHNGFGYSLRISTNKVGGIAYAGLISDYITGVEQYQYGGPGWGWPNWTTTRAGGTAAAPTAVPSNYGLNEYTFWGHDGTAGGQAYAMMTRSSETWTPTAHGIYTIFSTVATGSTSLIERMRFSAGGNITFNNASDTAKVSIKGSGSTSATTSLLVQNSSGNNALKIQDDFVAVFGSTALKILTIRPESTTGVFGNSCAIGGGAGTGRLDFYSNSNITSLYDNIVILDGTAQNLQVGPAGITATVSTGAFKINSTTQGFLKPKMTTAQKNAIVTPAAGLEVYDTDLNRPCFYNGTSWITL